MLAVSNGSRASALPAAVGDSSCWRKWTTFDFRQFELSLRWVITTVDHMVIMVRAADDRHRGILSNSFRFSFIGLAGNICLRLIF